MKKLLLLFLTVTVATLSQAQCSYNFHFGYTNYITKGQTNLNGFRATYWPRQYRWNNWNTWGSNSLANMGRTTCYENNNDIGLFGDLPLHQSLIGAGQQGGFSNFTPTGPKPLMSKQPRGNQPNPEHIAMMIEKLTKGGRR